MVLNSEGQGLTVAAPGLNLVLPEMIVSYTFFRMAKPDSATVPVITGLPLKQMPQSRVRYLGER